MDFVAKNRNAAKLGKGRNWNRILGIWLLGPIVEGEFANGFQENPEHASSHEFQPPNSFFSLTLPLFKALI